MFITKHHFILNQPEAADLDQRETESPQTKGREEEPEEYGSELLQFVKKEELEQETHPVTGADGYVSFEIKEEPEELKQMEEDYHQLESQQMVEVEDISQYGNKAVQETDTLMRGDSAPVELKEEPVELKPKQVKEEEHGSGPEQMVKMEAEGISQNEDQDVQKQETAGTDNQLPELNREQILLQNFPKHEDHQEIKFHEASGSSRDDQQQKRAQPARGQREEVEEGMEGREIHKVKHANNVKCVGKVSNGICI
ncbi:uncharacterized protein LOC114141421 [Xiphophorus couchianus]|uniref:uncharacterized protein LOC114141421 n=1 Tax=Xiphophorus couchianus TaxID=32473 RepID=UPI001016F46F|nr:uncharacterized protein LOC114141421 [Xiphophorus couchianus]